jgi:YD repeat-containing protein
VSREAVERLVGDGTLRRVTPDGAAATRELAMARRHIASSRLVAELDPAGALALAYDAARKAIEAHMRANGLRAGSGEGGHAKRAQYGVAAFGGSDAEERFRMFDRVRRVRNSVQYDAFSVEDADVQFALEQAEAIVRAVEADLR